MLVFDRQKLFDLCLKAFLFLSPLFFFKTQYLSFARGMFFMLGAFALYGISLMCEQKRTCRSLWLSLFLTAAFVRIFFGEAICDPRAEWFNFWLSCAEFMYVLCGVLLFRTVYCYADNIKQYFKPVAAVCAVNCLLAVSQFIGWDFMWTHASAINGFMETPSQLGQYSAMSLPVLVYLHPVLAVLPVVCLLLARSVSPILAAFIGMAVMMYACAVKRIWLILLSLAFVAFIGFNAEYIKSKFACRPIMWRETIKVALQKPYLGWGYRSFNEKVRGVGAKGALGGTEFSRAHNDYAHTAQETGFPILGLFILFIINVFRKFMRVVRDDLVLALFGAVFIPLIIMGGQTFIRYASVAGTFIVLSALFCVKVEACNG